jgi:hypothetical protein
MRRALRLGARIASRWWSLAVVLWLINALFGVLFALAAGCWLWIALDGSRATRTLLENLDANVLIDLYMHHGEGFRMLLVVAAVLALVYVLLWFWLHAAIILAVRGGPNAKMREAWLRGMDSAPRMAALYVVAVVVLAAFSAAIAAAVWGVMRWTATSPSAMLWSYVGAGAAALWAIGCVFLVAVHDHARIRTCASGQTALAAYRWAWGFVLRGGERAFPLAVALQAAAFALWAVYQAVGLTIPSTLGIGVTGSLLWGAAFMLARMWVRIWFFAAQSDLQS